MKETLIGLLVCGAILLGYAFLPMEWRRHKDIQHGDKLIAQVQNYQKAQQKLPENNDEATLQQLGFVKNKLGWQPQYIKQDEQHFEIIYQDGYEPPFLHWQSREGKWTLTE